MENNFLLKIQLISVKEYIFIFLTATIFLFSFSTKGYAEENVFTINNAQVKGAVDKNFSREKYLNKAFLESFDSLMNKILLTIDLKKIENVNLVEIKKLINSFQIIEESYSKNVYTINLKIQYNDTKVKKLLSKKNISFSQPDKISAVFYPILFSKGDLKSFNENYFYKKWNEEIIENEIINFILPLDDLDDISKILKMKDSLEEINVNELIKKYNETNYVIALMDYKNQKLNVHLKVNFENNKISKNILYPIENINNESKLNFILKDMKLKVIEIWKEQNLINLLMPLSINIAYQHKNLKNFENLKNSLKKISIIDSYNLEEFNIKNSFFKIYYYGNPKKLKSELLRYGYNLKNVEGYWQLYIND